MRGKHLIKVSDNRVFYELTINRNITIIRGDSATGKTTLLEMLDTYLRYGEESGIQVECDVPVAVYLSDNRKGGLEKSTFRVRRQYCFHRRIKFIC